VHQLKLAEPDIEVIWRAFELRPEPVLTLDPQSEYLSRAWRDRVYPLAEKLGMPMKMPPVQPRSRLAHEAAQWARIKGRFDDFNGAVFRAFFERGENIGRTDVLLQLTSELSLDSHSLRTALENEEFREAVLTDERAAQNLGVRAVPSFVADRRATVSGVQSLTMLQEFIRRVRP